MNKVDEKDFFNGNHLQGYNPSAKVYGLYFDNILLAVMSFRKPRFNANYKWELLRFAVRRGYAVVGGASKLFSYFRKYHKSPVISYASRRYSEGNLYLSLGFQLKRDNKPNYMLVRESKSNSIFTRYQTQKHKLGKLLNKLDYCFDQTLSETSNMENAGFYKVYDCDFNFCTRR